MASATEPPIRQRQIKRVEYAESSLAKDRTFKLALYARAGITDYWILNLVDRVVEVYREPAWSPSSPHGWRYASLFIARPADGITPLGAPHSHVAVADCL